MVLTSNTNTLVLFETEHSPCNVSDPSVECSVEFIYRPVINSTIPPSGNAFRQRSTAQELEAGVHLREEEDIVEEDSVSEMESSVYSSEFEVVTKVSNFKREN